MNEEKVTDAQTQTQLIRYSLFITPLITLWMYPDLAFSFGIKKNLKRKHDWSYKLLFIIFGLLLNPMWGKHLIFSKHNHQPNYLQHKTYL